MVKELAPLVLIIFALVTVVLSLFGEDSYSRLSSLRRAVTTQEQENETLLANVVVLREEIRGLRQDHRALEKAARNELGLARPDEQIFIFDKRSPTDRKGRS